MGITLSELKQILELNFDIDNHEAERIFQKMDTDGYQEIAYSEFLAAALQGRVSIHEDLLRATFHRFDQDLTGSITVENLRDVLGESSSEVEGFISEADKHGNGYVSYEDFLDY